MIRGRRGFTMVEMTVVVVIAVIFISMAISGFGGTMSGLAVENARRSFASLQARTRTYAVSNAEVAELNVDPAGDSVWIEASGNVIEKVNFMDDRGVDIDSSTAGIITLCMNPRGIVETSCTSFSSSVDLDFLQGARSASLTILPLGQLSW